MGTLYLIRHGLPAFEGEKRCIGATDLPLSEEGREQMRRVRERLQHANIRRIYVSPMARTRESAQIISGGYIPVTEVPELQEIHMGCWENLTFSEIRERYPEDYEARGKNFADFKPEGGETFRECRRRAYLAYRRILTEADGNIAIVAHAGLNRALISLLEDRSLSEVMEIPQAYGSVYHWNIGPRLGAVITAAGCSSRMGSLKPLLPLDGESLLERECRTLFRAGARQITIVTGREAECIEEQLAGPGITFVHNAEYKTTGMLTSACMGFRATSSYLDGVYFLPADAPLFSLYTLRREAKEFSWADADLFRPVYQGEPGHPLLIRTSFFPVIYNYQGECGLRGICETYSDRLHEIPVPDPGIVLDADVPEDYERLVAYDRSENVPSRERCLELMEWRKLPEHLQAHCLAVADLAVQMASEYNRAGGHLDTALVEAGGLLHDLEKQQPFHAAAAADLLCQLGFAAVADTVRYHEHLPEKKTKEIDEAAIVYLADKFFLGTELCTLKARYEQRLAKYTGDREAEAAIRRKQETAEKMLQIYRDFLVKGTAEDRMKNPREETEKRSLESANMEE